VEPSLNPADGLGYDGGSLHFEGISLPDLAARLPTPFFLLSERRLRANYHGLERGLARAGDGAPVLRYCAKTNPEAAILEILAGCGSHLLASHAAEVALALRCGFPPGRIAFARPGLRREELAAVLAAGVPLVHVHQAADLTLLEEEGARSGRPVRLSFRLRSGASRLSPLGGLHRRHGLEPDDLVAAARRAAASPWLEPAGVNFYLGTQQSSLDGFARALRGVLALLERIARETGAEIGEVNLGGGLPSPTLRKVGPRDLWARLRDRPAPPGMVSGGAADLASRVAECFRELAAGCRLSRPPLLTAEPGRSIAGNAAVLVSRVEASRGRWLFLDASRAFLPESPLLFSRRLLPLREGASPERFHHLSGGTLNTLDVLDFHRRLPALAPGDALAFCDAGAYSLGRASRYACLPPAVYLLQEDGAIRPVRRAEGVEDLAGAMLFREGGPATVPAGANSEVDKAEVDKVEVEA
jgi:diaminopimelate decarboxylase